MRAGRLGALALWPALLCGQLSLYVQQGGQETPVTSLYTLPSASPGDLRDTTFRVRNAGSAAQALTNLSVLGASFTLLNPPALPASVPAGGYLEFVVRFAPRSGGSYSAGLTVNTITVLLVADAGNTALVAMEEAGTLRELTSGELVDFGNTLVNSSVSRKFVLTNPNAVAVTIATLQVTGPYFSLSAPPALPLVLQPGAQASVSVVFAPPVAGEKNGTLQVAERSFSVRGMATAVTAVEILSVNENGSMRQLLNGDRVEFGSAYLNNTVAREFTVKNPTAGTVVIKAPALAGSSFSLSGAPGAPFPLGPGDQVSFSVVFSALKTGENVGALQVGARTVELRGQGVEAKETLSVEEGGLRRLLANGGLVDFGSTYVSSTASRRFVIANPTALTVTVPAVTLNAPMFRFSTPVAAPLVLQPGEQVAFAVEFAPDTSGFRTGTLLVGTVTIQLKATGLEVPVPKPVLGFDKTKYGSGEQGRVTVTLETAASTALTGNLFLSFTASNPSHPPDPAVIFLSGASKSIPLSFPAGTSKGTFNSKDYVEFQTGTTAGTLELIFQIGPHTVKSTFLMAAAPPHVDTQYVRLNAASVELRVDGFDNTRTISQLRFTFYNRQGAALGSPVTVDVASKFRDFFSVSDAGGLFSVQAIFPVTGDITQLGGVETELTNMSGVSRTQRLSF